MMINVAIEEGNGSKGELYVRVAIRLQMHKTRSLFIPCLLCFIQV